MVGRDAGQLGGRPRADPPLAEAESHPAGEFEAALAGDVAVGHRVGDLAAGHSFTAADDGRAATPALPTRLDRIGLGERVRESLALGNLTVRGRGCAVEVCGSRGAGETAFGGGEIGATDTGQLAGGE